MFEEVRQVCGGPDDSLNESSTTGGEVNIELNARPHGRSHSQRLVIDGTARVPTVKSECQVALVERPNPARERSWKGRRAMGDRREGRVRPGSSVPVQTD